MILTDLEERLQKGLALLGIPFTERVYRGEAMVAAAVEDVSVLDSFGQSIREGNLGGLSGIFSLPPVKVAIDYLPAFRRTAIIHDGFTISYSLFDEPNDFLGEEETDALILTGKFCEGLLFDFSNGCYSVSVNGRSPCPIEFTSFQLGELPMFLQHQNAAEALEKLKGLDGQEYNGDRVYEAVIGLIIAARSG